MYLTTGITLPSILQRPRGAHCTFGAASPPKDLNPFALGYNQEGLVSVGTLLASLWKPEHRRVLEREYGGYWYRQINQKPNIPVASFSQCPPQATPARYVDWGTCQTAPWDTPLATAGLFSCSALVLVNPYTQTQLLAHPFPATNPGRLVEVIRGFLGPTPPPGPIQAWILPGLLEDSDWSANRLKDALEVAGAPQTFQANAFQVGYAHFDPASSALGCTVHQGKLYEFNESTTVGIPLSKTLKDYDGFKTQLLQQS